MGGEVAKDQVARGHGSHETRRPGRKRRLGGRIAKVTRWRGRLAALETWLQGRGWVKPSSFQARSSDGVGAVGERPALSPAGPVERGGAATGRGGGGGKEKKPGARLTSMITDMDDDKRVCVQVGW